MRVHSFNRVLRSSGVNQSHTTSPMFFACQAILGCQCAAWIIFWEGSWGVGVAQVSAPAIVGMVE